MTFFKKALRRFRGDAEGATTVEFLVAMPLVVFWFAGTFTFFDAYSNFTRSLKATYTVADILSRQDEVDNEFITDMNLLFSNMVTKDSNDTWLRVTSVTKVGSDLKLDWSFATGLHDALVLDSQLPANEIPEIKDGEYLIIVESYFPFIPFQSIIGLTSENYGNRVIVNPRFVPKLSNQDQTQGGAG